MSKLLLADEEKLAAQAAAKKAKKQKQKAKKQLEKQQQQQPAENSPQQLPPNSPQKNVQDGAAGQDPGKGAADLSAEDQEPESAESEFLQRLFCCPITQVG